MIYSLPWFSLNSAQRKYFPEGTSEGLQGEAWVGGGEYLTKFNTGRLRPEVQPLPFYIPFWQKRYPFYTPFIEKRYLFHIPTIEHCTPFLSLCNEVNEKYYKRISSFTRRNVKQTRSVIYSVHVVKQPISLPFYMPQLVKSLPFYIPEASPYGPLKGVLPPPRGGLW